METHLHDAVIATTGGWGPSPEHKFLSALLRGITASQKTEWQLMLPAGRPKSSRTYCVLYLWHDADRAQPCASRLWAVRKVAPVAVKTAPDFAREVPEGTCTSKLHDMWVKSVAAYPPIFWHL